MEFCQEPFLAWQFPIPDLGLSVLKIREGNGNPLQYSCLENPMDRGGLQAAVHGGAKSRTQLRVFTFTFHFHALEKEMATQLQCSCLENPRDGGAWWAAVYGVTQSWTRLKRLSSSSSRERKETKTESTSNLTFRNQAEKEKPKSSKICVPEPLNLSLFILPHSS